MEQIKPPTDNLYKFIALFGLALAVIGVWTASSALLERNSAFARAHAAATRIAQTTGALKATSETAQEPIAPGVDVSAYAKRLEDYSYYLGDLNREDFRDFNQAIATAEALSESQDALVIWWIVLITIGSLIALSGFALWYWKTQRHQDQILVNERRVSDAKVLLENDAASSNK